MLPVLFFSVMFGFALLALGPKGKPIIDGIHAVSQVLFKMIAFAMYVAPIGAFGAIAFTVGRFGPQSLLALGNLVVMFYVCARCSSCWCCGRSPGDSGSTCCGWSATSGRS